MTAKENKKSKKTSPAKKEEPDKKLVLYELVEAYPAPKYVIIGALTAAGLLKQYEHEKSVYEKEIIEPSITVDEFNKIIKNFLGE